MLNRRDLLRLAAVPALLRAQDRAPSNGPARIRTIEFLRVEGRRAVPAGHRDAQYQVNPLHVYDELRPKEYRETSVPAREVRMSQLYLRLAADSGLEGLYGPIDEEAAIVVERQLKPFLLGKDAMAGETLWDQMFRSNRHSRSSIFMMAISAVDNTLWDLRGKYFNTPVYRLLGGPTRANVEAYGSCLGFSVEPELVRSKSIELRSQGFRHQKWFMPYGPGSGIEGLQKNVALVRNLREALGDGTELMFDAFQGWDLNYAIRWAKQVEVYQPRWIEEAFAADKIESFATLRRSTSVPVASGEHIYGRWEAQHYFSAGALAVIQCDPEWCGGVSELVRICGLASVYDVQVIPHGHSIHAALHVVASQSPMTCPLVENLISKMTSYYHFEKQPPTLVNARFALPERPGFGIELDPAKVERRTIAAWG